MGLWNTVTSDLQVRTRESELREENWARTSVPRAGKAFSLHLVTSNSRCSRRLIWTKALVCCRSLMASRANERLIIAWMDTFQ